MANHEPGAEREPTKESPLGDAELLPDEGIADAEAFASPPVDVEVAESQLSTSSSAAQANLGPQGLSFAAVRRRLLRGSAWVLGGRVVTTILGFFVNVLLARILTQNQMGAYFTAYTLVIVGGIIGQLGLDRAVVRFVSSALGLDRPGDARKTIRVVFSYGGIGSLAVALFLLATGGWVARHVYDSPILAAAIPVTAGWLAVSAIQSLLVETWRSFHRYDLATIFDQFVVDILSATVFGVFWVSASYPGLKEVLLLSMAFSACVALVAAVLIRPKVRALEGDCRVTTREIFAMAWPVLITNTGIYLLSTGVDLLVLGAFRPQNQVAIYGAATRLMILVSTPFIVLQGVTPPMIAELWAQGRKKELEQALRAVSTLAAVPAFLALLVFIFFGHWVLGTVYRPSYAQGASILAILSFGRLVAVSCGSSGVTLMMTGYQRQLMFVTVITGAASVLGGIVMAGPFGGVGVATSTAVIAIIQNLLMYFMAKRLTGLKTRIEFSPRPFLRFMLGRGVSS